MRWLFLVVCFGLLAEESPFLSMEDTRLSSTSKYVEHSAFGTPTLRSIEAKLREIAQNESNLVGLAAPQIGIFERVILVDMNAAKSRANGDVPQKFQVFVNPQVIWKSRETEVDREGCFSTGSLAGMVPRHTSIKVCAYTVDGEVVVQEYEGYLARVFQHEIDHLDGIRFPDRLEKGNALHIVTDEMLPAYREQWMDWNITCDLSEWESVKNGIPFSVPVIDGPEKILEREGD